MAFVKMATRNNNLVACLLAVELLIPIVVVRFSEPLTTLLAVSSWGLINLVMWLRLSKQKKKLSQVAYLIASAALDSCLCGVFLILINPSCYLRVTQTHFILNRSVLELAGSITLTLFFYTLLYRILSMAILFGFVCVEKRIQARRINNSTPVAKDL